MKKSDAIKQERMKRKQKLLRQWLDMCPPTDPQIFLLIMNDLPPAKTGAEAKALLALLDIDGDV